MKPLNLKQLLASVLVGAALVLTGWATTLLKTDKPQELLGRSNIFGTAIDVVGTRLGTTTTAVSFYTRTASTTYTLPLNNNESNVVLHLQSLATTTPSGGFIGFSVLSSQDSFCGTASTTYSSILNNKVLSDVKWADAANHVKNAAALTSLSSATTTFGWTNSSSLNLSRTLILTDVNARCLALEVAASSSVLQVQAMAR